MAGEIASAFVRIRPNMGGFRGETESGVRSGLAGVGKIVAGAFAAKEAFDFGKDAIAGAASIQKSTEVIKNSFGAASRSVLEFNEGSAAQLGLSAKTAEETSSRFGILFKNLGIGKARAAEMTVGFEQLTGSLSAIRGADPSEVMNKIVLAAAGNTRGLKQLGVVIDTTAIKQEALKLGLIKHKKDAIDPAIKAQAIYALATKHLGDFQDQARAHAGDLLNVQRRLSAEWSNAKDALGAALLPAVAKVASFFADVLPPTMEAARRAVEHFAGEIRGIATFVRPVVEPIVGMVRDVAGAFKNGGIGGAIATLRADFENLSTPAKVAAAAIAGVAAAIVASAVAAAPLTATALAVVGLAEGFRYAYEHSARFREIVGQVSDYLQGNVLPALRTVADAFRTQLGDAVAFVRSIMPQVQAVIQGVVAVVTALWDRFGSTILTVTRNNFETVQRVIGDVVHTVEAVIRLFLDVLTGRWGKAWDDVKTIVGSTFDAVKAILGNALRNLAAIALALGRAILDGVVAGMSRLGAAVGDKLGAVRDLMTSLPGKVKGWLGDLSRVLYQAGADLIMGFVHGIESKFSAVKSKLGDLTGKLTGWKGPPSVDRRILYGSGQLVVQGFADGVQSSYGTVKTALGGVTEMIITAARKYGVDAKAALAVALQEGGLKFGAIGDHGTSFGPFQEHIGGILGNMSVEKAKAFANSMAGIELAIRKMAEAGAAGKTGLAAIKAIVTGFERPADPGKEIKSAFDAYTHGISAGVAAVKAAVDSAKQQLGGVMSSAFSTLSGLASQAFDELAAKQTKSAALLSKMQAEDQVAQLQGSIAQAQKALTDAQAGGDAPAILAAQQQLYDAERQLQEYNLGLQAQKEEAHQQEVIAIHRRQFDQRLRDLQAHLKAVGASHEQAQREIVALFKRFGIDYQGAGQNISAALAEGIRQASAQVARAATELGLILKRLLKLRSPAEEGPLSDMDTWWGALGPTLMSGINADALRASAAAGIGAPIAAGIRSGLEGGAGDAVDRFLANQIARASASGDAVGRFVANQFAASAAAAVPAVPAGGFPAVPGVGAGPPPPILGPDPSVSLSSTTTQTLVDAFVRAIKDLQSSEEKRSDQELELGRASLGQLARIAGLAEADDKTMISELRAIVGAIGSLASVTANAAAAGARR